MSQTSSELPQYDRRYSLRPEYGHGGTAFHTGKSADANPHPSGPVTGDLRYAWYMGWYDAKFGH